MTHPNEERKVPAVRRDLTLPQFHMAHTAIGRKEALEELQEKLRLARLPVVITGIGGLGKTTLAQMYWRDHRDEYDCAAWLSPYALFTANDDKRSENAELFIRAFLDHPHLKTNLGLTFDPQQNPIDQFRQVIGALARLEGNHLLIVDNVSEAAAIYLPELSTLQNWRILFTSRDKLPNTTGLELDALSPEEAAKLFEGVYEKPIEPAHSEALANILRDIDYHTLTIELLAAYAREKKLDPPNLLILLREKGLTQLDDYDVTTVRSVKSQDIAAHLRDLFWLELDPAEQEILRHSSILPTSNVPLDPTLVSEDHLCELFGKKEVEKEFKKLLRQLARLHWLVEKEGGYRCHPVIAETAKAQLKPDAVNCEVLIEKVTRLLIPDAETNEPLIKQAPFAILGETVFENVWKEEGNFEEADDSIALLALHLGKLFRALGEHHRALGYDQKAVAILEKVLDEAHPHLALSYDNLGASYHNLGDFQTSVAYSEKAVAIREKVLSPEHLQLALSYNNLAVIYKDLGQQQKSLEYHQKALTIREKELPPEHPDLAESYGNLALTYRSLNDYQKSLEHQQKALVIREKALPLNHPDLALSYNNLALIYSNLGEYQKSLEYNHQALSILEKVLPHEHPHLGLSYNNLALTYGDLGDYHKSLEFNQKALIIKEKSLSSEHPDLAVSYNNLALIYSNLGDDQKSLEYNQKALSIWEKTLPAEHPHLASSYNNLALTYGDLGDHQKSLEYNQKALAIREKASPPVPADLANSYHNLALTHSNLGEYQKSLQYSQKSLAILEKILPPEHQHVGLIYSNMAWTYDALGEKEKAATFMRRTVAIWEKALPATHPYVAKSKGDLATLEAKLNAPTS